MSVDAELLLQAYRSGIFPMAERRDHPEIFWVVPRHRGIIPLDGFRISRSLAKRLKRTDYHVTRDIDFLGVIDGCADREETWINHEIRMLYADLHDRGFAHSLEVRMDGRLVGGICGESMFSKCRDGSKIALAWLVDLLRRAGFILFDTQFLTPHLSSLGGVEVTRAEYRAMLADALTRTPSLSDTPLAASGQEVVHRNTQIS
jgi:leucyl/phenylalanyl-tRNA--protein transferase